MPRRESYDGIVIGAGPNGLILQAYLVKAGLTVLAIDRAPAPGGGLATVEDPARPGVHYDLHALYPRGVTARPWWRDLDLERYGVRYREPEVQAALHLRDGRALTWHRDLDATCAALARIAPRDADAWRAIAEDYGPVVEEVVRPECAAAPLPPDEKRALLEKSALGRMYLEAAALSPWEWIERHVESPAVRALLLLVGLERNLDVTARGLGCHIPALIAGGPAAQVCVGGSVMLARGLARSILANGGEILTGIPPTRILIEEGAARGVELSDGSRIRAREFVASSLDPGTTFLRLVGADLLSPSFVERVQSIRPALVGPLFIAHALLTEAPEYRAAAWDADAARALSALVGLDEPADVLRLYDDHARGVLPPRIILTGAVPSLVDASQAPPGWHTLSLAQKVPYSLEGDARRWDARTGDHLAQCLARFQEYAPNIGPQAILHSFALTPVDMERRLPNRVAGDPGGGLLGGTQIFAGRPLPELAQYETPVPHLYLCGASQHPGGTMSGLPGYIAARVITEQVGVTPWWEAPDVRARWRALT